jgi:acyl-CoA thioesterase
MPFEDRLGVRVCEKHDDGVTVVFEVRPEWLNTVGILHGGVTASLADEAVWHALVAKYGETPCTTTELKVNYLRPIGPGRITARVVRVQSGRKLCVGQVHIFDTQGQMAALAVVTYMLLGSS